ncbi:isoaspartyl peptidase/L-asparaginase isoform X2 [Nematostella vectensis]|uniref:isoaspartyl peptidase/L-asparaginase isoform X2 n=1 Tax=Nematostella vectensis TaxID=45351 RepID=UPI0020776508|nr:isoaspartyl peptidase/L-asparaginase isoform X2 [Nematostella vectensis]
MQRSYEVETDVKTHRRNRVDLKEQNLPPAAPQETDQGPTPDKKQDNPATKAPEVFEDNALFNCGYGSKLNALGRVSMDAMMMDGRSIDYGGVCGLRNVANPITVAKKLMTNSRHCLLTGEGGDMFAQEMGVPFVSDENLITEMRRKQLEAALEALEVKMEEKENNEKLLKVKEDKEEKKKDLECMSGFVTEFLSKSENREELDTELVLKTIEEIKNIDEHDTVGAVAIDEFGNVACGTSTGGMTGVYHGRVGDSPIIGCGGYADNEIAAISTTGSGEFLLRCTLASHSMYMMQSGKTPTESVFAALDNMDKRIGGKGGMIVLDCEGNAAIAHSTPHMPWAQRREDVTAFGVYPGDAMAEVYSTEGMKIVEAPGVACKQYSGSNVTSYGIGQDSLVAGMDF